MKKTHKIDFSSDWNLVPAPESTTHFKLQDTYDLFINGKFVAPKSGKYFDTINPANEKVIIELGNLSGEYLKIMNAIGQVVYDAEIKNTKIEIDLSDFANGIYTIQVQTAKGIVLKKLVKN